MGTLLRRDVAYRSLNANRQRLKQFLAGALSTGNPHCLCAERDISLLLSEAPRGSSRERSHTGRMQAGNRSREHSQICQNHSFFGKRSGWFLLGGFITIQGVFPILLTKWSIMTCQLT